MSKSILMTHIVAGYPDIQTSEKLVESMEQSGVSFVEIQIPFSDPVADGSTLMQAQKTALENGTTTEEAFELMARLKKKMKIPLLFMTYYNVLHAYGVEAFCKRASELGVYGLIVPDIPIDEEPQEFYIKYCKKYSLHPIQVISSTTPPERLKKISEVASGFVYCVSREGTTGNSLELNPNLAEYIQTVRKYIKTPLALGFGISSKDHVQAALKHVDIAIMGSAVVNCFNAAPKEKKIETVKTFLSSITSS